MQKEVKSHFYCWDFPFLFQFLCHVIVAWIWTLDLTCHHLKYFPQKYEKENTGRQQKTKGTLVTSFASVPNKQDYFDGVHCAALWDKSRGDNRHKHKPVCSTFTSGVHGEGSCSSFTAWIKHSAF